MDFGDKIMAEIAARRELFGDTRESEDFIRGLMRAVVIAHGQEEAEALFARHGASY
jgi:CO dehydrogenase/acetyl-CoA synthase alpha subunit